MKIRIDDFLTAEELGDIEKSNPVFAVIKDLNFLEVDELPFESKRGKYELTLKMENEEEEIKWIANKTSLKNLRKVFGTEKDNWIGKKIKLWTVEQLVQGVEKRVLYAEAA